MSCLFDWYPEDMVNCLVFTTEPWCFPGKMRACKFGRALRLFWDWGPTDHKNDSIFSYLLH